MASLKNVSLTNLSCYRKALVKRADQAVQLTENAKDKHMLLHVWSQSGSHYVVVDESQTG